MQTNQLQLISITKCKTEDKNHHIDPQRPARQNEMQEEG